MFCLLSFATVFMAANNPNNGLTEEAARNLGITKSNLSSNINLLPDNSDAMLNITANTDPTEGFLGSRDSVASAYGIVDMARGMFTSTKTLVSWVFSGEVGQMLLLVFGGLFGLFILYFGIKLIRNGI